MTNMLFTIVIPLYNKEKYIRQTVDCVLSQTIEDYELLIIDDGSTDGSLEIVSGIVDPRIRIIHQENGGVSKARNRGIREAKGKYITFLDADDVWTTDFLETCLSLFQQFPDAKVVCPSYQMKYENRIVNPTWRSVSPTAPCLVEDFFEMATAPCWIMTSSCVAVEANAIRSLDYLFAENEWVYEDYDMWLRLGARFPVAHSPKICGVYNRVTDSNARNNNKIIYSQTFMKTINNLIEKGNYSSQQVHWLNEIKDRRVVPYVFSLLLFGDRKRAKEILSEWQPTKKYSKYRFALQIGLFFPRYFIELAQKERLKRF